MRETCPHCHATAVIRTSESLSPTLRHLYCRCTNPACGHYFVSHAEIIGTLSPAAVQNPDITLPVIRTRQQETLMQQLHRAHLSARECLSKKPEANPSPTPAPARPQDRSFMRTARPAQDPFRTDSTAASESRNAWHPAPGFVLPADIGRQLPAEHCRLI